MIVFPSSLLFLPRRPQPSLLLLFVPSIVRCYQPLPSLLLLCHALGCLALPPLLALRAEPPQHNKEDELRVSIELKAWPSMHRLVLTCKRRRSRNGGIRRCPGRKSSAVGRVRVGGEDGSGHVEGKRERKLLTEQRPSKDC